ncbi:MAG TPA: Gfo/Idh/MocA family oxidoreductase [Firmicutes bacterium]|nr:Gfo/Idh/MocA family oxidoreductase [Bacillota bacterium]
MINVALCGLRHLHPDGYMALFAQVPEMRVVAASEADELRRREFAAKFGVPVYTTYQEALEKHDVQLAAIFLPHAECPEAVEFAAAAGAHVLVEKPMAADAAGIGRMIAACERAGVVLTTPYLWRYHQMSREIKRLVTDGVVGEVIALEGRMAAGKPVRYQQASPWMLEKKKSGGGAMHNLGVHWIDLFRWLLEDEVVSAYGDIRIITPGIDVEDQSFALLTFSRGARAYLDISYTVPASYPHGRDLFVGIRGTAGTIAWSPAFEGAADEMFLSSEKKEYKDAPWRRYAFDNLVVPGYCGILGVSYLRDLAESLTAGRPPVIPGREGLKALQVVEAVYQSAALGRPVSLS